MKKRELVTILGSLLVLTILWVVFTIYHNLTTSTIKDPLTIQIIPISGKFDTKTLDDLKKRDQINPDYQAKANPSPSPEANNNPTSQEATTSAQQASNSSNLVPNGGF